MPISFRCSNVNCGKAFKVKDELAGKRLKCPECSATVQVPAAAKPTGQAEPPAAKARPPVPAKPGSASGRPPAKRPPATPLEEQWGKSPLLNVKAFVVRQKTWVRKYGPDYDLLAVGAKENSGEANVRPGTLAVILGLFSMQDFVSRWIEVADEKDTLFWLKVVKLVNNRYDLYDPARKELLGSVKTIFSTAIALRLLNAEGKEDGEVVAADLPGVGNQSYYGFNVMASDGRKMGDVTNEANDYFRRTGKRSFSGAKGYVGTIAQEFAADPKAKVLVLATALAARMEDLGVNEFDPMKA